MALSDLLKNQKIAAVLHRFRSRFRDWAAEKTDHPREIFIERDAKHERLSKNADERFGAARGQRRDGNTEW